MFNWLRFAMTFSITLYWQLHWPTACVRNCLSALTQRITHIQLASSFLQRVSCWRPGFMRKFEPLISQTGTLFSLRLWIMLSILRWSMIAYVTNWAQGRREPPIKMIALMLSRMKILQPLYKKYCSNKSSVLKLIDHFLKCTPIKVQCSFGSMLYNH